MITRFLTIALLASLVFVVEGFGQSNQAGPMIGTSTHTTYWFRRAQSGNSQQFPIHVTNKIVIGGFFEKAGLFQLGNVRSDLRFEIFAGIGGQTKEDWLPKGETISDGDIGYGAAVILKFGYPLEVGSGTEIFPFIGLGMGVSGVSAGGEASEDTEFASSYFYDEGFADGVAGLVADIGSSFYMERFILTPELRFLAAGDSYGDWDYITSSDGADWFMFMVNLGFKL